MSISFITKTFSFSEESLGIIEELAGPDGNKSLVLREALKSYKDNLGKKDVILDEIKVISRSIEKVSENIEKLSDKMDTMISLIAKL